MIAIFLNQKRDRSWERVRFSTACSFRTGGAGLELIYRGEMKEPSLLTVPTFALCYQHNSFFTD